MSEQTPPKSPKKGGIFKRLVAYLRPVRPYFILALTLTVVLAIMGPIRPVFFQYILDHEVANSDVEGLRMMILIVLGITVAEALIMYGNTYLTNWLGQTVIRDIRRQVFRHLIHLQLRYFDRNPIGMLQTRVINDVETLNNVFSSGLVKILGDMLQLVAIVAAMFYVNWRLSLVVIITVPLLLLTTWIFKNKIKSAFTQERKKIGEMNAFIQEHLTGMQIVHIFNREKEESRKFGEINRDLQKSLLRSVFYYAVFFPVVEFISAFALALLVWYGAGNVLEGVTTRGELFAFIMFVQLFFRPIRMLADEFNTLQLGMVSAERVFNILDTDDFIANEGTKTNLAKGEGIRIEFRNVWFAYTDEDWVLKDVSFMLEPGQKLALVGATGSGKSTIINLLSRFYEIQKGEILVNGVNIRDYDLHFLRSLIGVVLQDVFLFSDSVQDNMTLYNASIPAERIREAAAQVGAEEFISKLPEGYDYLVRERGATLSLGQRQLIAFARVLIYDPKILVLDEATANIDTESEQLIQKAIDTVMTGRTSIIIAHRLSTIQKADMILVMKKGRVIESGSHTELIASQGAYYQLHQLQLA
jgi:ATP-binding cassette subfamily B protein